MRHFAQTPEEAAFFLASMGYTREQIEKAIGDDFPDERNVAGVVDAAIQRVQSRDRELDELAERELRCEGKGRR